MSHALIASWRKASIKTPPFLFPGDEVLLHPKNRHKISIIKSFSDYCRSDLMGGHKAELQLGLLPLPYWGDLQRADVFILLLNPGLRPLNYYSEYKIPSWRKLLLNNLRQKHLDPEYPNLFLNPRYCWDGGFTYWTEKFSSILKALIAQQKISYQKALKVLSRRVACLQLLPYHSRYFKAGALARKLASSTLICSFVHETLLPKARKGQIRIIVIRGNSFWSLREEKNVTVYGSQEARGASMTLDSRGRKAIMEQIRF